MATPTDNSRSKLPRRRNSLRLGGFDYRTPGAYFVTVATHRRLPLLGSMSASTGSASTSAAGRAAAQVWTTLSNRFECVTTDIFVVMPDHIHGIIFLGERDSPAGAEMCHSLSTVVGVFKSFSAREINKVLGRRQGTGAWQRGFHDRVIRNEAELNAARHYVETNPLRWWLKRNFAGGC